MLGFLIQDNCIYWQYKLWTL